MVLDRIGNGKKFDLVGPGQHHRKRQRYLDASLGHSIVDRTTCWIRDAFEAREQFAWDDFVFMQVFQLQTLVEQRIQMVADWVYPFNSFLVFQFRMSARIRNVFLEYFRLI